MIDVLLSLAFMLAGVFLFQDGHTAVAVFCFVLGFLILLIELD